MADDTRQSIRNIALISYPGAGKTSLAEALLFTAGAIPALGAVSTGTTVADSEPEEIRHHHSINASLLHFEWHGTTFNLLDTPGSVDFLAETKAALQAVDAVLLVVGTSGIRTEIERLWEIVLERHLPSLIFVNELDRDEADFESTVKELEEILEITTLPITLPLGIGSTLSGVIDLIERAASESTPSSKTLPRAIPDDMMPQVNEYRKRLIEGVAEVNDELLEQYLGVGDLDATTVTQGLLEGTKARLLNPLVCGSALRNVGVRHLLDHLSRILPSPEERAATHPIEGVHPQTGEVIQRNPISTDLLSVHVFKTTIDPFMGRMSYVRVYSGTLEADSTIFNSVRNTKEKGGHLYQVLGKKYTQVPRLVAGDIGAIGKLKDTQTGDTLCLEKHPIRFPRIAFPRPVLSFALDLKSKGDIDKVSLGLHKLCEEDPSLDFHRDDETKEMLLSGVGKPHIEITLEKLQRKYGVEVQLHTPKVAYRETILRKAKAQGKYKKQTGGHGQYGDCWLEIEPRPRGAGFEFTNQIVGGVIPRNFIPAVEKGVLEAMQEGFLAGCPIVDIGVSVYDGSYHPVDSSEMAFKVAASMALRKAMEKADPILLEPMMTVDVTVPDDLVGPIIGDLNSRRGKIAGMESRGHNQIVHATVPLAEMLTYAPTLNSLTAGKGSYMMEFAGYESVPRDLMPRLVEELRGAKQAIHSG